MSLADIFNEFSRLQRKFFDAWQDNLVFDIAEHVLRICFLFCVCAIITVYYRKTVVDIDARCDAFFLQIITANVSSASAHIDRI